MNAGKLRHRIEFKRLETTFDTSGFPINDYITIQKAWADMKNLQAKNIWNSKQNVSEQTVEFHTRYFSNIDNNCIIIFNNKIYEIVSIDNVGYLNKELKIQAKVKEIENGNRNKRF